MILEIPNEEYHARSELGSSHLKEFLLPPVKFHQAVNKSKERKISDHLDFGHAYHAMMGEPHLFKEEIIFQPPKIKSRNGKAWDKFLEKNAFKTILTQDQKITLEGMAASWDLPAHSVAKDLYFQEGPVELSFFAEIYGVRCKARTDKIVGGAVIDLKTDLDASYYGFSRSIKKYGYDLSAFMYLEVVTAVTGIRHDNFIWIVQEKEPPYPIAVYQASDKILEAGRGKFGIAMETYKNFQKGEFPWYPNEIREL